MTFYLRSSCAVYLFFPPGLFRGAAGRARGRHPDPVPEPDPMNDEEKGPLVTTV